jgi:hypothetical protein
MSQYLHFIEHMDIADCTNHVAGVSLEYPASRDIGEFLCKRMDDQTKTPHRRVQLAHPIALEQLLDSLRIHKHRWAEMNGGFRFVLFSHLLHKFAAESWPNLSFSCLISRLDSHAIVRHLYYASVETLLEFVLLLTPYEYWLLARSWNRRVTAQNLTTN